MKHFFFKHFFFVSLLLLFSSTSNAQLIIYNGTFDSVTTDQQGDLTPVNWDVPGGQGGDVNGDAYTAPYAARVFNWNYIIKGEMFYGFTNNPDLTGMPLLAMPTVLKGYYKYVLGNNSGQTDSAEARVHVTLFDQVNGVTDTVATGHKYFTPSFSYIPFSIPINVGPDSLACDTLQIQFLSSVNGTCDSSSDGTCCYLYLDELSLEFPNGITKPISLTPNVSVIYNAATNNLTLKGWHERMGNWSIALVDAAGHEILKRENVASQQMEIPAYVSSGLYLYRIYAGMQTYTGKVLVNR